MLKLYKKFYIQQQKKSLQIYFKNISERKDNIIKTKLTKSRKRKRNEQQGWPGWKHIKMRTYDVQKTC